MKKRNTKIALASLMATSAVLPAAIVSAEEVKQTTTEGPALKYFENYSTQVADGIYDITIEMHDPKTGEPGYTAMDRHIEKNAKLVVREGKHFIQFQATQSSNSMVKEYYKITGEDEKTVLTSVSGSALEYPHVVEIPLDSLEGVTDAGVWVYYVQPATGAVMIDKVYPFGISVKDLENLNLPKSVPTYVYQDKINKISIMHDKYLTSTSVITAKENGKYDLSLTFPQGQYIEDFVFEGKSFANPEVTVDEKGNEIHIYTVEVDSPVGVYDSTIDLNVVTPDFEGYRDSKSVQIQVGGQKNPFNDINSSYAYKEIQSLFTKGIFLPADKFNPKNDLPRAHFALMLNRAFKLEVPETTPFTDIAKENQEIQDSVKALYNFGAISGTTATTFSPNNKVERYQAALMISNILKKYGVTFEGQSKNFTDLGKLNDASKQAIDNLSKLGIINGKGDNKFDPFGTLQRQEMSIILDKTLELLEKK